MKVLKMILAPLWDVAKWVGQSFLAVMIFTLIIAHPLMIFLLAADYGKAWLLLYIPMLWIWGWCLKNSN